MAFIYKITNSCNNKSYIGCTGKTVERRWKEHLHDAINQRDNRKFYNAIRKHGIDCWVVETLMEVETLEEAKVKEIELIALHETYENGYNSTKGGDGNNGIIMSLESNKARSKKLKGVPKTYDRMLGKTHSEESKQKISISHKGKKKPWVKWTKEQCVARGMTRRSLTEEQYELIHSLRKSGLKIKTISEVTEISTDLVKKWLKMEW